MLPDEEREEAQGLRQAKAVPWQRQVFVFTTD